MKPIFLLILSGILFYGCENFKEQFEQVSRERDSLIYVGDVKDSSISSFLSAFNEIETNLDSIVSREKAIDINSIQGTEISGDQRERINENIRIINDLLGRNRTLMANLQRQLRVSQGQVSELNTLSEKLQAQVNLRETELAGLKQQLNEMNLNLDNLNVMLDTITAQKNFQEQELKSKTEKLNTAYYIVGTFKELQQKNILGKEGGFLGIGKNKMLKQDFNSDAFNKIDIRKITAIDLGSKSVKVITNHPSGSYSMEKDKDKIKALTITDYETFWGASKYLVIVKE